MASFYVYRIFDLAGTLYIGKGSGRRLQAQKSRFRAMGEVLKTFASEHAAYRHEQYLIKKLQPPLNRCGGGGGPRSSQPISRRAKWEVEIERTGTRRYAARGLLRFDLSPYLDASKIEALRQVANGPRL